MNRVVLGPAVQDLDGPFNLLFPADNPVDGARYLALSLRLVPKALRFFLGFFTGFLLRTGLAVFSEAGSLFPGLAGIPGVPGTESGKYSCVHETEHGIPVFIVGILPVVRAGRKGLNELIHVHIAEKSGHLLIKVLEILLGQSGLAYHLLQRSKPLFLRTGYA
jgi:hypothetical protein